MDVLAVAVHAQCLPSFRERGLDEASEGWHFASAYPLKDLIVVYTNMDLAQLTSDVVQVVDLLQSFSSVPGLGEACSLVSKIYTNCQSVKDHEDDCHELRDRCVRLVVCLLQDTGTEENVGIRVSIARTQVIATLVKIAERTENWTKKSFWMRLRKNDKIARHLVKSDKELNDCMTRFNTTAMIEMNRKIEPLAGLLLQILSRQDQLTINSDEQQRMIINTVQATLLRLPPTSQESDLLDQGLHKLFERTIPPSINLTGKVVKCSTEAVNGTVSSEIWKGILQRKILVAIKVIRTSRIDATRVQRFEAEARVWRALEHENILPFFGIASDQGASIALISPWMDNGDASSFVEDRPDCDRRRILRGTAKAMQYLHGKNIVHGDLRGSNVLIDYRGEAQICDFRLAAVLLDWDLISASSGRWGLGMRWSAPELFLSGSSPNDKTDVFSFGRTILEIMTGAKPFLDKEDGDAFSSVAAGISPLQPKDEEVVARGLTESVWVLVEETWDRDPSKRPTMDEIVSQTEVLLKPYVAKA